MKKELKSISFENIGIQLEGQTVLQGCSFDFPLEQSSRVVFSNDKEKFIFFHAMTQVEGIVSGKYLINGNDVSQFSFEEFLPYRLNIGFGFSTRGLIHNRTIKQNLELPIIFHKMKTPHAASEWVSYLCEYFGIEDEINKRPSDVSTNVQKVALILRAFVHCPELVILDTPEVLLSRKLHANLLQLISDQKRDHGLKHIIFASQDEGLSDCLADKNIILKNRKMKLVTPYIDQRVAS